MQWPEYELGQVASIVGGGTPARERDEYWAGDIAWVTPTDLPTIGASIVEISETKDRITQEGLAASSARMVPAGTVLLSSRATIGKVAIAAVPLCTNQGFANLIPKRCIDSRYLAYALQFNVEPLSALAGSTTFKEVPKSALKKFRLLVPPLSEQRRIVEILDQADHLRRLRAEANSKADRILPALFLKMFGDPAMNPMGWPTAHVGAIADVQGGLQLSRRRESNPIQVPYLRVANVYRDRLQLNEIKLLGVSKIELERTRLLTGDVLVVEGHGNKAEIGRCAVWNGSIDPCVHQNHLIRIRPDRSRVVPSFVSAYLNSAAGRQQLLKAGKTTSGLNTISVANVKNAVIFLPPLDRQEWFDRASTSVVANGQQACEASAALHRLWKQLLSRGFRGDLTRGWREPRMAGLRREMERQAAVLARESS